VDATLFCFKNEFDHFHPSADTYDTEYESYTKFLPYSTLPSSFYSVPKNQIKEDFGKFDFIIGCSATPAYLNRIGRKIDIFIPYGGDIYSTPFISLKGTPISKLWKRLFISRNQKQGINSARYISMEYTNSEFETVLNKLNIEGKRLKVACPFIYVNQYESKAFKDGSFSQEEKFREIRQTHDLIIFHHSRHMWANSSKKELVNTLGSKRNDKLIEGFAKFVKESSAGNPCLVLFEYGLDVDLSKELIKNLKIESNVIWMPLMPRREIMRAITYADIGAGEFGKSWYSYGTIYEFMAMGKPVMHYREDSLYRGLYPELYPMIHANSPDEIAEALKDYSRRPDYYRSLGEEGRFWFQKYAVEHPLNKYMDIIKGS
jgi:hypothetical protein